MKRIYFDNAATTAIDPLVVEEMLPFLTEKFGNPSSIYSYGREARLGVETARKTVAKHLGAQPSEIFFTSGGTESTNTAITAALRDLGCKRIISSPIEHHATLHSVEQYAQQFNVEYSYVDIDSNGHVNLDSLEKLFKESSVKTLVSLMHANNEIGNLLDVQRVGDLCEQYNAVFHCDTVQTVAHYPLDFKKLKIHFATGAAHKFHGPKGVGILFINSDIKIQPFIHGGAQERNMRAGTENVYGIVGLAKALDLAMSRYEEDAQYISGLKNYMIQKLQQELPDVQFNGDYNGQCLYTVLNVSLPKNDKTEVLLFSLDVAGVCVSAGSACSSGAQKGSHVISALKCDHDRVSVRFSFCKHNTKEEVDTVVEILKNNI